MTNEENAIVNAYRQSDSVRVTGMSDREIIQWHEQRFWDWWWGLTEELQDKFIQVFEA